MVGSGFWCGWLLLVVCLVLVWVPLCLFVCLFVWCWIPPSFHLRFTIAFGKVKHLFAFHAS